MSAVSTALLVYSAQLLVVVSVAALAAALLRLTLPVARFHYWRAVVVLGLLLPAIPRIGPSDVAATVTFGIAAGGAAAATAPGPRWTDELAAALPWLVVAGAFARLLWLAGGALRLSQLRRGSQPAVLNEDLLALRDEISACSDVRWTHDVAQPVTFGWRRPVVLLPGRFDVLEPEAQQAVLCHEVLHVRRRDWPGIVAEELVRAVLWFHPAVWWALEQIHLSREQVVDQQVVARTCGRRAYMEALVQFADAGAVVARPAIAFLRRRHLASRLRLLSKEPRMTRLRLACAAAALLLVMAGTTGVVVSALPLDLPALGLQGGATTLEVRLAELQPGAGLSEAVVEGSGQHVYLRPDTVVTAADVTSALVADAGGGHFSVNVSFSAAGSNRLAESTKIHIGRPVAIVLNGRVIAAPVLRSQIRDSAVISGDFTKEQADRIAAGLGAKPAAAAAPGAQRYKGDDPGVVLPVAQFKPRPEYTPAAMEAKIQGVVELSAVVRTDGTTSDVTVVQSLDTAYGLDDSAVAAVSQWTFTPGTKDGTPVDVEVHIMIRFTLT